MSQGNIIQGQASGKLGDTVLMVRNGTQVARVYTTSGARSGDAASFAARLQRVRFGSASNQWQLYRYICTRMFRKGRRTNQSDYNYFVKRNVDNLPYFTKLENADGVCCMMPGQFSEGNLGRIELLSRYGAFASTQRTYCQLSDTINPIPTVIAYSQQVSVLKNALKVSYPNARKITYLLVSTYETEITETSEVFISQFFQHNTVMLDLYSESRAGENTMTIKEYFAANVSDQKLKDLFNAMTGNICGGSSTLSINSPSEEFDTTITSIGALIFASNDLVSDCYTTILPADGINLTTGVYSVWAAYRTDNALQVACDSYGFQSGVMRDEVAASEKDSTQLINSYISKLSVIDEDAAKAYAAEMADFAPSKMRTVRRSVESSED